MRTDKCKEITKEMSWQECLAEYRKLSIFEEIMSLPSSERILVSRAMFSEYRVEIIASLPKDLSPSDLKRQLYERTYGEPIPDGFPIED